MKLQVIDKNILLLLFSSQKEMTLTMFRSQEYYECGNNKIRNKVFEFEDFLDFYTEENGDIDYFRRVSGFNIPSNSLEDFFIKFNLTRRENKLWKLTRKFSSKPYYLLAAKETDTSTLDHELVHAYYYLNEEYKKKALFLIKNMRSELHKQIIVSLKRKGYAKAVFNDEINAFMATSDLEYLHENMKLDVTERDIQPFKQLASEVLN